MTKIIAGVLERNGIPGAASTLVTGGKDLGEAIVNDADIPLGQEFMVPRLLNIYRINSSVIYWQRSCWPCGRQGCTISFRKNNPGVGRK